MIYKITFTLIANVLCNVGIPAFTRHIYNELMLKAIAVQLWNGEWRKTLERNHDLG